MGKLNRLTSWILVAAMVLTLFSGVAPMAVHAEETPAISAAYPEATELLTNMGIMNNSEKAWNEQITAEEANSLLLSVVFAPWWNFDTFGLTAMAADEAVTGEKFLQYVNAGLNYGVGFDVVFSLVFHMTAGIDNYDPAATLTREQAAQILNNFLKANPQYNQAEQRGNALGLSYVKVSADAQGRPSYQWVKNGSPITAVYAAKPIAVVNGGSTWNDIMAAAGFTGASEAAIAATPYWEYRMFNYTLTADGQKIDGYGSRWPANDAETFYSRGWKIEIYPAYAVQSVLGAVGLNWTSSVHELVVYPTYLSDSYAEATDFMFHYLVDGEPLMSNETVAWTEQITPAEANKVIDALLYKSLIEFGWAHPLFAEDEAVTCEALLLKAQTYLGWSYRTQEVLNPYFQLASGLENYTAGAVLTREQAAQIFLNVLRATTEYAWNGAFAQDGIVQPLKLNDGALGLSLAVTRDNMGRPSYQWLHNGAAITNVHKAKPLYVAKNSAVTYATIMNAVGYTPTVNNSWHYPMNKFGVNLYNEGSNAMTGWYFVDGDNGNTLGGVGYTVEVYDGYFTKSYILEGNYFCSRMYDIVTYCDLLADVKTEDGVKKVNMYGQPGGYGYWEGQVLVQNVPDGKYIVRWHNAYGQVQEVTEADSVLSTLAAFNDSAITVGDKVYTRSSRLHEGLGFLTAENLGKYFVFYFDTLGNVIGIDPAPSYTVTWLGADGTVLQSDSVYHGEMPAYVGETPVKTGDAQYSYTFTGWDAEIVAATQDAAYTAQFAPVVNTYTVTWIGADGAVLETDEAVPYGTAPEYNGETPVKAEDETYTYTFAGWTPETSTVTGDITYTAQFTAEEKEKPIEKFELYGANVTLGNNLDMKFAFAIDKVSDWTGHYVKIVKENAVGTTREQTYYYDEGQWQKDGNYYVVVFTGIAAKEMSDELTVTVYNAAGEAVSEPWVDSMRAYAMRQLNSDKNAENALLKTAIVDMLNYGAAAQKYFDYDEGNLANALLTDAQKKYATESTELTLNGYAKPQDYYYYGSNLTLKSNIVFQIGFENLADDMTVEVAYTNHSGDVVTASYQVKDLTLNAGIRVVVLDKLVVSDARQVITITVKNAAGGTVFEMQESIEEYMARRDKTDIEESFMKFSDSAHAYLHRNDE